MAVLAAGVPLSLMLDLAAPGGPDSGRIYHREAADLSWLAGLRESVAPGSDGSADQSAGNSRAG